ncbi:MAG: hypothetical protein U1E56_01375 [Bauldia sp.]
MSDEEANVERAAKLKERIYLSFTGLAVVLALAAHGETTAGEALVTLAITMAGTLLAMLLADIVSHLIGHSRLMSGAELRHAVRLTAGAIAAVALPLIFLAIAAMGTWSARGALRASAIALIAWLVVIGLIAARHAPLPAWQRLLVLAGAAVLGVAVVGLELLAHR